MRQVWEENPIGRSILASSLPIVLKEAMESEVQEVRRHVEARVLPYEQWDRLPEELDPILANISPVKSRVCVIEEDGEIVARWILMPLLHAECIWIAPERRKTPRVGLRLLDLMKRTARSLGFERVVTASMSEDVTKLLVHPRIQAQVMPGLSFVIPVVE